MNIIAPSGYHWIWRHTLVIALLEETQEHLTHGILELLTSHREAFDNRLADECVWVFNGVSTGISLGISGPEELASHPACTACESGFLPIRDMNLAERHASTSRLTDSMPRLESDCRNGTLQRICSLLCSAAR